MFHSKFCYFAILVSYFQHVIPIELVPNENDQDVCVVECAGETNQLTCGFDEKTHSYLIFKSACRLKAYNRCYKHAYVATDLKYCIRYEERQIRKNRRTIDTDPDDCPLKCPSDYDPVCGASHLRSYNYRTFVNLCYLKMTDCRGNPDNYYHEVPLIYCQDHLMKNIFKETVVVERQQGTYVK